MRVVDADGHVEENLATFSDKYFDPAFRTCRPRVVGGIEEGLAYWMIDEQLFPRRVGRGCHNLGTPASYEGRPVRHAQRKPDTLGSMELTSLSERLQILDEEPQFALLGGQRSLDRDQALARLGERIAARLRGQALQLEAHAGQRLQHAGVQVAGDANPLLADRQPARSIVHLA